MSFIKASLVSLAVGVLLGVLMALQLLPDAEVPRYITSAHAHVTLLGAVMMLIFGVGYHILPRFSGRPLYSEKMSDVQLWLNIIGLAGMFVSLLVAAYSTAAGDVLRYAVAPFGALFALGALLFVLNIWKTVSGALPAPTPLKVPGGPGPGGPSSGAGGPAKPV
ncbi:MAG: cbb3-type cytochrome c oxidase subunit I [Thermoleophilia bacterium]|nr:cbb3-type cytochrome c oxidase subunit I [Thermoleophilia bacterium]